MACEQRAFDKITHEMAMVSRLKTHKGSLWSSWTTTFKPI